jgi:prepilin-type processing-associated H-X9-DG protein
VSWVERIGTITGSGVVASARLPGGSLGGAFRFDLADGRAIVAKQGPSAGVEAKMLRAMAATGARVPAVLHDEETLLLMEFVEGGRPNSAGWRDLAAQLAMLHAPHDRLYGWPDDYSFSEVAICNREHANWAQFWGEHRIACHAAHLNPATARRLDTLARRIGEMLPAQPPPALLHGDLWGGNMLFADGSRAVLLDPACYVGDREVDIAMLTLFDHPPDDFFAQCDLAPGWRERQPLYRLWPLLVHLRLSGDAYRGAVERALAACRV